MRFLFVDESGTGRDSAFVIVAGVMIEADHQLRAVSAEVTKTYDQLVRPDDRDGFRFHATELVNGKGRLKFGQYSFDERLDLIKAVACLPRAFDAPLFLGAVRVGHLAMIESINYATIADRPNRSKMPRRKLKDIEMCHLAAFNHAITESSHYLTSVAGSDEVCAVIAEDHPQMKFYLTKILELMHLGSVPSCSPRGRRTVGPPNIYGQTESVRNVVHDPLFMEKGRSGLLDIADACCFVFRRVFNEGRGHEELCQAMLGETLAKHLLDDRPWATENAFAMVYHQEGMDGRRRSNVLNPIIAGSRLFYAGIWPREARFTQK